jgi:dUTP pyrophosphatase
MFQVYCKDHECYPERVHVTDAGLDLKTSKVYNFTANVNTKVYTGIHVEIEPGYAGFIYPRSGLSTKKGLILANTVGVIDSDYRGEIICVMRWEPPYKITNAHARLSLPQYSRIAQLVIAPIWGGDFRKVDNLEDLSSTERGDGGFGHTGT